MKQVQELLAQQMTRKEFIRLFSLIILGILGVNNFISLLKDPLSSTIKRKSDVALRDKDTSGFGTRKFGV